MFQGFLLCAGALCRSGGPKDRASVVRHFVTFYDALRPNFKFWNESGTNRARIADSSALRLRSPQHLALTPDGGTRSSLAQRDKGRIFVEFLKFETRSESNQK